MHSYMQDANNKTSTSLMVKKKPQKKRTVFESCFASPQRGKYTEIVLTQAIFFSRNYYYFLIKISCGMLNFPQISTLIPKGISSEGCSRQQVGLSVSVMHK